MAQGERKPLTERGRFWLKHIQRWMQTDDGPTHFCRTHSLSIAAFTWWRKQFFEQGWLPWERPAQSSSFVELMRSPPRRSAGPEAGFYEVLLPNERRLRIPAASFDIDHVQSLVSILESPC